MPTNKLLEATAPTCIAIAAVATLVHAGQAHAQESTWLDTPFNNDYNTAPNWDTGDVPSSAGDTAVFGQSNTTLLNISAPLVVDAWAFNADADNYVFTSDQTLTFVGDGIAVAGGVQGIVNNAGGTISFYNSSGAGDISIVNNDSVLFTHNSSAENATITNNDELRFFESATAGNASIANHALTRFFDGSSGGSATIATSNTGTTQFAANSTAGDATLTVADGGTLEFEDASTADNATISNAGTLLFTGNSMAGTAQITNAGINSSMGFYDSSTAGNALIEIDAASFGLLFSNDSTGGSAVIRSDGLVLFGGNSTADNATIINRAGADLRFSNSSTAGNATIANATTGEVRFLGDSTAGSATITNYGTMLFVADSDAGNASILNEGLLRLEDNAGLGSARVINEAGAITEINPLTAASTTVGSIEGAGDINLGDRGLITGLNDLSTEVSGILSGVGGALVKVGDGALTLSGLNTYTGVTQIIDGALIVKGSIASSSAVAVNLGATLGGDGIVATTLVGDGGTVAPGNSIGTLNVAGDVTFAAGSAYEVEINSAGQSDLIDATGIVTLDGGTVEVVPFPDYVLDTQYTVLTAAGGVVLGAGGMGVDFANASLFLTPTLAFGANDVFLTIAQSAAFDSAALTPNQIAAAGGAQSLGGGELFNAIALLGTEDEARAAFDAVSGEIHASSKTALIEDSRFVREAANARLLSAGGNLGVWTQAFGASGHTDSDGNAATLERSTGGVFIGADGEVFNGWQAGVLAGYNRSSFSVDGRMSSGSADSYYLGAYGGTEWNNFAARFGGVYSWHDLEVNRSAAFTGFSDSLSSSYSAGTGQIFGEVSYGVDVDSARFEPFANVAWVNHATTGFTEDGGAAALDSASDVVNSTFATLGLRASTELVVDEASRARLSGAIGWRHAFGDTSTATNTFVAGGDAFGVAGVPLARDALVLEASFDMDISPDATLGFAYSGQLASGVSDHSIKANFGVRF